MFAFIVRRIIQSILVMLVISLVGFSIQHSIGDPVRDLVGERVTPAEREVIRDRLGLNDPFYTQYFRFVKKACKGDLGMSFFYKEPALAVIIKKAPATIELVIVTSIILIVISIPVGIYSAIYPKSWFSRLAIAGSTPKAAGEIDRVNSSAGKAVLYYRTSESIKALPNQAGIPSCNPLLTAAGDTATACVKEEPSRDNWPLNVRTAGAAYKAAAARIRTTGWLLVTIDTSSLKP